jgi:putative Holliday junction resolvase
MSRVLAIDYGYKRIGLAVSDPLKVIASPLGTIAGSRDPKKAVQNLEEALKQFQAEKKYLFSEIVVGLPLHMDGSESERSKAVRAFVVELGKKISLPIHLFDERLTSVQAERALQEVGFTRKKRASLVDGVAAVIILQTFLSKHRFGA